MRTIVSSASNSGNNLNSSSTLLSTDTDPLMSAGSCSTFAGTSSNSTNHNITLKIESKCETDTAATAGNGATPGRNNINNNNISSNSSSGGESLCNSPSYQRSQNNYSLPPINGLTSSFKQQQQQQQQMTSTSASHSPARRTLTVNHSSNSSGGSTAASPLSLGGAGAKTPDHVHHQRRQQLTATSEQQSKRLYGTTVVVRERSVSANQIPAETNSGDSNGGGNGFSSLTTETVSVQGIFSPQTNNISFTLNDPLVAVNAQNGQDTYMSPSSGGTGSVYSPPNITANQQQNRQNTNNSSSSSYTTLMPLQLTALPPIANVSDKFAASPLRMYGSSTASSSSASTGTNQQQVNGSPSGSTFMSQQQQPNNGVPPGDSTNVDSGNVVFISNDDDTGHQSSSNGGGGENAYVLGEHHHHTLSNAFSGIDANSLMNLSGLDLINGDGLLSDFQSHDAQLQHIDNFSSLPLQQQLQSQPNIAELQPPAHYYQQNPFSHLGNHYQNQSLRLTLGNSNVFVSANNNTTGYAQDPMMTRQLNTSSSNDGIHVHVGSSNSGNVIMMGNAFDGPSFGLMDQFSAVGDSSQIFAAPNEHGNNSSKDQHHHQQQSGNANEPRILKPLIPQPHQQQQQQPLTFVTIQGQMPVGAIKITIPTQQQQQQPQPFYHTGPGGFMPTAIINSDGRIIVPSNMLFTGPGGQTFLVNPGSAMPLQQQQHPVIVSSQQQQAMHPEIANEVIVTSSMPLRGLEFLDNGAGDYDDNDLADEPAYERKPTKTEDGDNKISPSSKAKQSTSKTSLTNVINKLTSKAQQQQQQVAGSSQNRSSNSIAGSSKTASSSEVHSTRAASHAVPVATSSNNTPSGTSTRGVVKKNSPTVNGAAQPANPNPAKLSITGTHAGSAATASNDGRAANGNLSDNATVSALPLLAGTTKGFIVRPLSSSANNNSTDNTAKRPPNGAHRFTTLSRNASVGVNRTSGNATVTVRKYQPLPILPQQPLQPPEQRLATSAAVSALTASGVAQILAPISDRNPTNGNIQQQHASTAAAGNVPEGESLSSTSSLIDGVADGENGSTTDGEGEDDDDDGRRSSSISNPEEDAEMEKVNTRDLSQRVSAELKRYSIPQAVFAQRVLCRSQGTLSDLLRNPKPWSKLKSGRETFRRMWRWLQEPEFQRMSALRLAACKRKEIDNSSFGPSTSKVTGIAEASSQSSLASGDQDDGEHQPDEEEEDHYDGESNETTGVILGIPAPRSSSASSAATAAASARMRQIVAEQSQSNRSDSAQPTTIHHHSGSKKPRLVFTESQKRTLIALFKENRRPSKDMQLAIADELKLDITTVSNFFMNARRRSQDKWLDETVASTSGIPTSTAVSTIATATKAAPVTTTVLAAKTSAVTNSVKNDQAPPIIQVATKRNGSNADATAGRTNGTA